MRLSRQESIVLAVSVGRAGTGGVDVGMAA